MSSYLMLTTKDRVVFYSDTLMTTPDQLYEVTKIFEINNKVLIGCLQNNNIAGIHFNTLVKELQANCSHYTANQMKGYLVDKFSKIKEKIDRPTVLIIVTTRRNKINTLRICFPSIYLPPINNELLVWDSSGDLQTYFHDELTETLKEPFKTVDEAHLFARRIFQRTELEIKRRGLPMTTHGFDYKEILYKD